MKDYLTALSKLFDNAIHPKPLLQGKYICTIQYSFYDTLGSGFGASWENQAEIRNIGMELGEIIWLGSIQIFAN